MVKEVRGRERDRQRAALNRVLRFTVELSRIMEEECVCVL